MATYVEIANLAAAEIGTEARVADPDEDRVLARAVKAVWGVQRQAAIREGSWNFAEVSTPRDAGLAALAEAPAYPWASVFELPSDCLRLLEVHGYSRDRYRLQGQKIHCDSAGPLFIRYLADIEEPGLFDAAFAHALALRIAWSIGRKIAGSTFDQSAAWKKYELALGAALTVDAIENPPIEFEESDWVTARSGTWY